MADERRLTWPAWANERTIRLYAGVVLFIFVFFHLMNAGLLLFGLPVAGAMRPVMSMIWESFPGAILLYGSLILHPLLSLKRLALRRTWRMPIAEALQTLLGLAIPFWMARHVIAIRGTEAATGIATSYRELLTNFNSQLGYEQGLLVLIVWVHGCIGIATALRVNAWFFRWRHALFGAAVFVPTFALAGLVAGIREVASAAPVNASNPVRDAAFIAQYPVVMAILKVLFALVAAVIVIRYVVSRFQTRVMVRYAEGPNVRGLPGMTLLEISRQNNVPHAAVCGGKARCSTCRVRIIDGAASLPQPNQAERRLLARISAPENVRLACQLRPDGEISVQRLVEAGNARAGLVPHNDPFHWGVERQVTLMFADIRGFTAISEKHFAYDIVFTLNRFQADMARVIEANNGRIDKYLGDGLMAIFGLQGAKDAGSADALRAAAAMLESLSKLNEEFEALLGKKLRIGIGLHSGPAILGRIGAHSQSAGLTALGDTVNVAARLEELTKTFGSVCVVSENTLIAAYGQATIGVAHEVAIRGRQQPLAVRSFDLPLILPENEVLAQQSASA